MNHFNAIIRKTAVIAAAGIMALSGMSAAVAAGAEEASGSAAVQVLSAKTVDNRYYRVPKTAVFYKKTRAGLLRSTKKTAPKAFFASGKSVKANGNVMKQGQDESKAAFIKLTSGIYKGYYIKATAAAEWEDEVYAKRRIVTDYGRSMNGGVYSWGSASYRCTDCSGLTMQCYQQIGIDITHSSYYQATVGRSVKLKNAKPGDILILNYASHVALYLGDGKIVHAMNSYDGIKIQPVSVLQYYHVDSVRRVIR